MGDIPEVCVPSRVGQGHNQANADSKRRPRMCIELEQSQFRFHMLIAYGHKRGKTSAKARTNANTID